MERFQVWGFFGFIVLTAAQNTTHSPEPRPSYLLLVPRVLRPGVPTVVTVTILTDSPVSVSVLIHHGGQTVSSHSATVEGGSTDLLTLPPIHESESSYRQPYYLEVKGQVGSVEVFFNSTQLHFDPKSFSTFIQTDRSRYGPGQMVRIRVVSVWPDRKPFVSPVNITIRDPRGNLLRQWLSLDGVLGVVSKEFQLSENPPLGEWTIGTTVASVLSEKRFTVSHYVLPKFDVSIDVVDVVYRGTVLPVRVSATYSFGMPVQGYVNITFVHSFHGIKEVYEEYEEINGMEDFMFNVPDHDYRPMSVRALEMEYGDGYMEDECLMIVAVVTDRLTGLTYNDTTKVSLAKSKYTISFDGSPKIFRPSLNFTAVLKIMRYDNQPLSREDQETVVDVTVTQLKQRPWSWEMIREVKMESQKMVFPVPADGRISFTIHVTNDTETLTIDASLEDSYNSLYVFRSYTSPSDSYMQINHISAEEGSRLSLYVNRNFPAGDIHYIVKSRGQVVSAGTSSDAHIDLVPEISWAPLACIIVYCVHPSGEIINDVMQLPITQTLQNQVSLNLSTDRRKPGEMVTLSIKVAEPASLVGILVVDKATKWKGSNNDITKEMVLQELSGADAHSDMMTMGDPYSVFQTCDLVALTDASLHMTRPPPKPELPGEEIFLMTQTDEQPQQQPRVRSDFPETWIWMDINTGNSDSADLTVHVPDSITTWVATAFVMSENLGLGIIEEPVELTVFQEFFLFLNLPPFIIRGEELILEVILFNYLYQDLEVTVVVRGSEMFEFVLENNEEFPMSNAQTVSVGSRSGASVLIPIKPLVLGEIPITVTAMSPEVSDHVYRMVLVKAEGLEQLYSTSLLFELSPSESNISRNVHFTFPPDVVEGSKRASVTAVGDILGPSISGLDSLIQMPSGCGEQNMINFAPNIYVLQYLSAVGQADQETTDRATDHMITGYERELTYQREDGSFSAFGEQDSSGSTWLTAFVLRCFLQARPFISIDAQVLQRAAAWLAAQQGADGSAEEPGRVIHTELQGGLDGVVSLTAYVVIALMEDSAIKAQYNSQVSAALMFLETRLVLGVSSNYSLSLLAYALALSDSNNAAAALSELLGRAQMRDGVPMWSSPDGGLSASWQPRSADIEMASYVLLTQHRLGHVTEGLGLMKWLSQQRGHLGGFGSTQDTVVALQALAAFAALTSHDVDLQIRVNTDSWLTVASFHIHQDNHLLHLSQQIDPDDLNLQVSAEGRGFALFQLNVFYNIRTDGMMARRRRHAGEQEAFHLDVRLMDAGTDTVNLNICFSLSEAAGLEATGMAILDVGLLSGFRLQETDGVWIGGIVKKVETAAGKVIVYLDSVTRTRTCLWVFLVLEYKVAKVQKANVVIYDYYEPTRRMVTTYKSERRANMSSSAFCSDDGGQCRPVEHHGTSIISHSSQNLLTASLTPALLLLFIISIFSV